MILSGNCVVVTGGSSGLGYASAAALVAAGARVAILDRDDQGIQAASSKLECLGIACDVTDELGLEAAFATIADKIALPRAVVNCAGIGPAKRILGRDGKMPLADFSRIVNVNLNGSFNVLRIAAELMSKAEPLADGERGVIVNTASVAAFEGQIGQAAYAASKGGVVSMTLPAARELARFGIRVLAIAPGLFATPLMASLPKEAQQQLAASVPFPVRLGLPEEFAKLALHMIENPMLNGEVVRLDGALRLGVG